MHRIPLLDEDDHWKVLGTMVWGWRYAAYCRLVVTREMLVCMQLTESDSNTPLSWDAPWGMEFLPMRVLDIQTR